MDDGDVWESSEKGSVFVFVLMPLHLLCTAQPTLNTADHCCLRANRDHIRNGIVALERLHVWRTIVRSLDAQRSSSYDWTYNWLVSCVTDGLSHACIYMYNYEGNRFFHCTGETVKSLRQTGMPDRSSVIKVKKVKAYSIALNGNPWSISELRCITCRMGSHSVTCHPIQANTSRRNPSQAGRYSIYLPRKDGRLSWPR